MMLEEFKLQEHPFGVTPDPRYLFWNAGHTAAAMSLVDGIDAGRGFLALIAAPGLGKTTLLQHVLKQLRARAKTVFLFQTVTTPVDILRAVLGGLGVQDGTANLYQMQQRLKEILVEHYRLGKRVVLVIDEAQNLDEDVLELVRMLSNFETSREKLIQIILCGQPQLAGKIASPALEQLRQRVSVFAQLHPFSAEDTKAYVNHRLRVAGYPFTVPLFTRDALTLIAEASDGVPRKINNLCFNALSLANSSQRRQVDSEIVRAVVADLNLDRFQTALVLKPRHLPSPAAVPFRAVTSAAWLSGWIPKAAVAVVLLAVVIGALFAGQVWPSRQVVTEAKNTVAETTPSAASSPAASSAPAPAVPAVPPPSPTPTASLPMVGIEPAAQAETQIAEAAPIWAPPSSPAKPTPAPAASGKAAPPAAATDVPTSVVDVTPGKTLLGICAANFGRACSPEQIQQIRDLNPHINDLDHIEIGQHLRLPASKTNP